MLQGWPRTPAYGLLGWKWAAQWAHAGQGRGHSHLCQEAEASEDSGTQISGAADLEEDRPWHVEPGWRWVGGSEHRWGRGRRAEVGGGPSWPSSAGCNPLLWFIEAPSAIPCSQQQQVVQVQRHPPSSPSLCPPLGHCNCHKNRSLAACSVWAESGPAVSHSPASRAGVCFIIAAWLYFSTV